jgi:hypothetical protein
MDWLHGQNGCMELAPEPAWTRTQNIAASDRPIVVEAWKIIILLPA